MKVLLALLEFALGLALTVGAIIAAIWYMDAATKVLGL